MQGGRGWERDAVGWEGGSDRVGGRCRGQGVEGGRGKQGMGEEDGVGGVDGGEVRKRAGKHYPSANDFP